VSPAHAKRSSTPPIPSLTKAGKPNVRSQAAVAWDAESGEIVYAKNANKIRSIASTTKIFVAMVVRRRDLDLNELTEITKEDAAFAKGGSRTRLVVGHKFRNQDLLRAMLISSDNRACTAVARGAGLSPKELIKELNKLAKDLGLKKTKFTDPSGLNGNTSTALEMSKALTVAMSDPFLAEIMSTKETTVRSVAKRPHVIHYRNTNRSLHSGRYEVRGGKTGFTTAAGYCLLIDAKINGRRLHMTFLGAKEKLTRFGDFGRVAGWVQSKSKAAPAK
jgi:D-alanyl-D-alanine endopeptidase (penicillin-binding protein 7)